MRFIFFLVFLAPTLLVSQVHGGLLGAFCYNSLAGPGTSISDRNGFQAGAWVEPMATKRLGVCAQVAYVQRGGVVAPELSVSGDYVAISILPRLHWPTKEEGASFVVGLGGYYAHLTEDADRASDIGLCAHLGVAWRRVSAFFLVQRGVSDVLSPVAGGQRWNSTGVCVQVGLF